MDYQSVLKKTGIERKDYQEDGIKWMVNLETRTDLPHAFRGGFIADEMGLGKTILCISTFLMNFLPKTLIIVPPILLKQWEQEIYNKTSHKSLIYHGTSRHNISMSVLMAAPIVLTTYSLIAEKHKGILFDISWDRIVFDEAHHLPGSSHQLAARGAIAPFRLGLTATLEREDGLHSILLDLIGPTVFRREINDLAGEYLANYSTNRIWVELLGDERIKYEEANLVYQGYLNQQGYSLGSQGGWKRFIWESTRNSEAKSAFRAFLEQKKILHQCEGKMVALENILEQHRKDRILVFTVDNATVHQISRRFLVPSLTHNTRSSERKDLLQGFQEGRLPVLATSRVLNEGVDVPAAGVAVVLSGSGTVREHVQRLGRILRKYEEKQAILYELVVKETREEMVSQRRRRHDAYQ